MNEQPEGTAVDQSRPGTAASGALDPPPERLALPATLAWCAALLGLTGAMHAALPTFFDGDTGYHLAVARLTRTHGVLQRFEWTPFSWMAEHYADKEFLFHILMVPVSGLDPTLASAIAGTACGAILLTTLFLILRQERVPGAGLWTLLTLASSSAFIARFLMVRPHLLSIPLALLITWAAVRQRFRLLAACALLYPLCYTAWHLPPVLVCAAIGARWLGGRGLSLRPLLWALPALLLGIAAHPNFPANVELFWIQNFRVLFDTAWSGRGGFDLGGEFRPFSLKGLGRYVLWPAALGTVGLVQGWRTRREDPLGFAFAGLAGAFFGITLMSQRFLEYLVPFSIAACAVTWRPRGRTLGLMLALGVTFIATLGTHPLHMLRSRGNPFHAPIPEVLGKIIPEGAQVISCDWRFTGEMMLALPERRFVVALDPVFFAAHDPERYALWFEGVRGRLPEPASVLRERFDADFVMCDWQPTWKPFLAQLRADPSVRERGVVGPWTVVELEPDD